MGRRRRTTPGGGPIGYLVRVGRFPTEEPAERATEVLLAEGFEEAAPTYTGFDGGPTTGPWVVNVLDIELHRFTGELVPELGTHVVPGLETLTDIAARTDPLAAVNGGYFVIEPIRPAILPGSPYWTDISSAKPSTHKPVVARKRRHPRVDCGLAHQS